MTKKQIVIVSVIAAILIGLIIAVSVYGKSKNPNINSSTEVAYPERRQLATSIECEAEADGSKSSDAEISSDSKSTVSSNSGGISKSAGSVGSGDLYQKTYKAASPESSGYPIPKINHFYRIEGSLKPSDPHKAELKIYLDFENSFDTQLQELRSIIQPILGSEITDEVVSHMKTKTSRNVGLDQWWETDSKKINVGSGYGSYIIEFMSWSK